MPENPDTVAMQIAQDMKTPDAEQTLNIPDVLIPSGSKNLNLACADTIAGAYCPGRMVNLIGDSSAGKSFVALSSLAEMAMMPEFDNYRFIYDDSEEANSFNMEYLFGPEVAGRIEAPSNYSDGAPKHSHTIQEFQVHVFDAIEHDSEKPFIYILDSFDGLSSKAEIETAQTNMTATRKGTKEQGSYGMDKPKLFGQMIRMITAALRETNSFLLIISQTRDDINPRTFSTKTRSGGNALKFYASHEIWLASLGKIKKTVKGQERIIGVRTKAKVTKNKLTGKVRECEFIIYYDYGVDDIGSCVDFCVATDRWEVQKKTIKAAELDCAGMRDTIIKRVEESDLEDILFNATQEQWTLIENSVKTGRKSKFKRR